MILSRSPNNPILKPNPANSWENSATFNGSIIKSDGKYVLFYRALGDEQKIENKKLQVSVIGKSISADGVNFNQRSVFLSPKDIWEKYGCEDPRVTYLEGKYFIFYTALSSFPPDFKNIRVGVAISPDLQNITERHLVTPFNAKAMVMFPEKINGKYTVILTVNTDNPPTHIALAQFEKLETLWDLNYWQDWYQNLKQHIVPLRRVNSDNVEVGAVPLKTSAGWVFIHSYIKHYFSANVKREFRIEAVLLDLNDPQKIIGRIENPLLIPEEEYEKKGNISEVVFPEGALVQGNTLRVYYGAADTYCALAEAPFDEFMRSFEVNLPGTLKCNKFPQNPILEPIVEHSWESKAVFNPGAVELENKIYLIYRAVSEENVSQFGLAISQDGLLIDERIDKPIYSLRADFEKPLENDKPGGVEDPRITKIGDILYMFYTAYNGKTARLAISSIAVTDFLQRKWEAWSYPKVISPPKIMDKDGMIFPEKINDKYVIFHRIEPNICIDFVENLDFSNGFLKTKGIITPHNRTWDEKKIGINTPPMKTAAGWIVFYHGISKIDGHYRVGALLLDLSDVTKVIGWTPYPILEPETDFEERGLVDNVVFPCGYVIRQDTIYLYYGGADKVVCGATVSLKALLTYLLKSTSRKYLVYP